MSAGAGEAGDTEAGVVAMDGATMVAVVLVEAALADVASRRVVAAASVADAADLLADAAASAARAADSAVGTAVADMAGAATAKQRAVLCGFHGPSARRAGGALARHGLEQSTGLQSQSTQCQFQLRNGFIQLGVLS